MLTARPGESKSFTLFDLKNPGVGDITSEATVTFDLLDAAGVAQATATASAGGANGNDWSATLTVPTTVGRYTLRATIVYGGETFYEYETVEVRVRIVGRGVDRAEMRRRLGDRLRDHVALEATAAGSTTTFTDALTLRDANDSYRGSHLVLGAGTEANRGLVRRVTSSDRTTGTLTVAPALGAATAAGDLADLYNLAGNGFLVQHYDRAMAAALDQANQETEFPLEATLSESFDRDSPSLAIPDAFTALYRVEYRDEEGEWQPIPPITGRRGRWAEGWWVEEGSATLQVRGCYRDEADGRAVKVFGYGAHDALTSDEDLILVDPEWFELTCAARLAQRRTTDREWASWAVQWANEARERRLHVLTAYQPNTVRVR